MSKSAWKIFGIIAVLAAIGLYAVHYVEQRALEEDAYRIAVVSKGLDTDPRNGILRGVRLYVDQVNATGGVNGRQVSIDVYDDLGQPEVGKEKAAEIVKSEALAVIGHRFSAVSSAAGPVYREAGMPAVAAASTSPTVTKDNPWYFRTIFNNNEQGRFLAQYAKGVLGYKVVHVVHGPSGYSKGLAKVFAKAARKVGIRVVGTHALAASEQNAKRADPLEGAKAALQILQKVGEADKELVFLALYPEEANSLIQTLRDEAPNIALLGVNALARKNLPDNFADLPRERITPGFYTNGMYVATPMIYDTANQRTGLFLNDYIDAYGDEPDWRAAFAYDAAKVILEAIDATGPEGQADGLKSERKAIRDWIAELNTADRSVPGVTGDNYFDANGDPVKPISVAQFRNGIMVSAPFQLAYETDSQAAEKEGADVTRYGDRLLRRSNIVYTGISVDSITSIDAETKIADIAGEIWFRYRGDIDVSNLVFENSVDGVELDIPHVDIREDDGTNYRKYRFEGSFRMDALPGAPKFGEPMAGLAFRHSLMDMSRLIFVEDVIGRGGKNAQTVLDEIKASGALKANSEWRAVDADLFSSISLVAGHGHPAYLSDADGQLDYSSFNFTVRLADSGVSPRRALTVEWAAAVIGLAFVILFLVPRLINKDDKERYERRLWFVDLSVAMLLLIGIEGVVVGLLDGMLDIRYLKMLVTGFDILWWFVPAFLIIRALERFVWRPIEITSERPIPGLLRGFVGFVIFLFAFFGVVAFVFDEKVTSLLATSGVLAMIIGLAIQLNISHLFSGIAINLERPFRVGDWVKIGSHEEAKVTAMTWRATRLQTRNFEVIHLPNTKAAESTIKNYAMPTDVTRLMHRVRVHPTVSPDLMTTLMSEACVAVDGVLEDPYPIIFYLGVTEWASEFDVAFFIDDYQRRPVIMTQVWKSIWRTLREAGIKPAIQRQEILLLPDGVDPDGEWPKLENSGTEEGQP